MLQLRKITKVYKTKQKTKVQALTDINYEFKEKGFYAILGKSGSGKTTLLNIIAGLDKPTRGEVIFEGQAFSSFKGKDFDAYRNTCVGFVFQEFNLLENLNVYKNVSLALELQGRKATEAEIIEVLRKVGIEDLIYRNIYELSGGQKQRVAIARALIKKPRIIIADEPTGSLDQEIAVEIFEILKELSKEYLVILVTHNEEYAETYAEQILHLAEGRQKEEVSLEEIEEENRVELEYKKSLSIFASLKMGFTNLRINVVRLVICIILSTISFSCFGFCITVSSYSEREIALNSVVVDDYIDPNVIANWDVGENGRNSLPITKEKLQKINNDLQMNYKGISQVYAKSCFLKSVFEHNNDKLSLINPCGGLEVNEEYLTKLGFSLYGNFPQVEDEIIITEYYYHTFTRLGYKEDSIEIPQEKITKDILLGKPIYLSGFESENPKKFKICGIVDTGFDVKQYDALSRYDVNGKTYAHDFNLVQQYKNASYHSLVYLKEGALKACFEHYDETNGYTYIIDEMPKNKEKVAEIYDYLNDISSLNNRYVFCTQLIPNINDLIVKLKLYQFVSGILGGIASIFSVCLLYSLLSFTIENKKKEMGVLRALGAKARTIFVMFSSEGIYVNFVSLILAYLGSSLIVLYFNHFLKYQNGIRVEIYHFNVVQYLILLGVAIAVTILAIAVPVIKVVRKSPAEAIRMEIK